MLTKTEQKIILLIFNADDNDDIVKAFGHTCAGYHVLFRSGIFKSKKNRKNLYLALRNLEKYGLIEKGGLFKNPRWVRRMTKRQKLDFDDARFGNKNEGYELGAKEKYKMNRESMIGKIHDKELNDEMVWNNSKLVKLTKRGRAFGKVLKAMIIDKEKITDIEWASELINEKYFPGLIEEATEDK